MMYETVSGRCLEIGDFKMTTLETSRLIIRNFQVDDWEALRTMILQYEASAYAIYDHEWPTSPEEIRRITEWFAAGDSYFAVRLKGNSRFVGFVSLNLSPTADCETFNLGYCFNFEYHGQGYATEGCQAAIGHAFDQLHAGRVVASTAAENRPSCRLLERLGLTKTAESTSSFRKAQDGSPIAFVSYAYAISRGEWEAKSKRT
jgi:ribosomal-protein-alanine N-acetyltransferase